MSTRNKHALQAALNSTALLTSIFLYFILTHHQPADAALMVMPEIILTFAVTLICWWAAFPSEHFNPLGAAWAGTLIVIIVLLLSLLYEHAEFDKGPLVNGGSLEAMFIFFLAAVFIPVSIAVSLIIRWLQTRKTNIVNPPQPGKPILKVMGTAAVHLIALSVVLLVSLKVVSFLTNDYVGPKEEQRMSVMGYQFKVEIENYNKHNGSYPESLDELPTAQSEHFAVYRKWGAFGYQANGTAGYSLIWRYRPSKGIICPTDLEFWPGNASIQTEDRNPPSPDRHGCYAVNPGEIRRPPWLQ